jgi:hypothetical protein
MTRKMIVKYLPSFRDASAKKEIFVWFLFLRSSDDNENYYHLSY